MIEACQVKDLPVLRLQCPDGFTTKPQPYREKFVEDWLRETVDPVLATLDKSVRHAYAQDFGRIGDLSIFTPIAIEHDLTRRAPFVIEMKNVLRLAAAGVAGVNSRSRLCSTSLNACRDGARASSTRRGTAAISRKSRCRSTAPTKSNA